MPEYGSAIVVSTYNSFGNGTLVLLKYVHTNFGRLLMYTGYKAVTLIPIL